MIAVLIVLQASCFDCMDGLPDQRERVPVRPPVVQTDLRLHQGQRSTTDAQAQREGPDHESPNSTGQWGRDSMPMALSAPSQMYLGQDVFTIAEIECRKTSNFLRGWWARVTTAEESTFQAVVREHLAITHNKDVFDSNGNPDTESVYYGDFWCVPKQAWCYKTLTDRAFGSDLLIGSTYDLDLATTAAVETKLLNTFKHIILSICEENEK